VNDETVHLEFLKWKLRYAYPVRDNDREEYADQELDALENKNGRRVATTIAEPLRQEGGRAEG